MKTVLKDSLTVKVPVSVYESVEEADKAAGRQGAMLDCGNNSLAMYGPLVEFRDDIADLLEKVIRTPRAIVKQYKKTLKDGTVKDIVEYETEKSYWDGIEALIVAGKVKLFVNGTVISVQNPDSEFGTVFAVNDKGVISSSDAGFSGGDPLTLQGLVNQLQEARKLGKASPDGSWVADITTPVRIPKTRKLPDECKDAAERVFGNGNEVVWQTRLASEGIVVTYGPDRNQNVLALGWGFKEREDRKRRAEAEKAKAAMATVE